MTDNLKIKTLTNKNFLSETKKERIKSTLKVIEEIMRSGDRFIITAYSNNLTFDELYKGLKNINKRNLMNQEFKETKFEVIDGISLPEISYVFNQILQKLMGDVEDARAKDLL